jgi:hypothetical protein
MDQNTFDKAWDEIGESGISWTATDEKPLILEHWGKTFQLWPEHHERSGTVQWHVEVEGTRELLGFKAGPDDTEEDLRQQVERYWLGKRGH